MSVSDNNGNKNNISCNSLFHSASIYPAVTYALHIDVLSLLPLHTHILGLLFFINSIHNFSWLCKMNAAFTCISCSYMCCCCSIAPLCQILCDPMDYSMPGSLVFHCLLEFARAHVHGVDDAIQSSSSVVLFSSWPQSFLASGSLPMSQLFA